MGVIADLLVKVGVDTAGFTTGMAKVNTGLEESSAKSGKFGSSFAGAGLLVAGALTGIVGVAGAAIAKTEEAGQAAFEMSEKFGLSGQRASEYLVVGKQLGLSSEQIGKGFQFLSKNVSAMALTLEAGGHISKTTGQVYKDLGINVPDAGGKMKSADELMLEAADAFKGMKDGPEKAALSMKLFGKSGTDMLPMLNEGRKGIEGLITAGKEQGDVMSNDQVNAAHKLFLEHKKLDTAIAGVTTQIGTALMPIAIAIIPVVMGFGGALGNVGNVIKVLQPWFPLIATGLTIVGGIIAAVVIPMFIAWTVATWAHVTASIAMAAANLLALGPILLIIGAVGLLVGGIILLVSHWKQVVTWVQNAYASLLKIPGVGTAVKVVVGLITAEIGFLITAFQTVVGWIQKVIEWLGKIKVPKIDLPVVGGVQQFAAHPFGIGGPQGHATGGRAAYTGLHWLEKGELVQNAQQEAAGGIGGTARVEALLEQLIAAVTAQPSGQTGVAAALYKAVQLSGVNRLRGMAGA